MLSFAMSNQQAECLNRVIMNMFRPPHLRQQEGLTETYCGSIPHPSLPVTALFLPEQDILPTHIAEDGAELLAIAEPFISDGVIDRKDAESLVAAITSRAGQLVNVLELLPLRWRQQLLSESLMQQNGWFKSESQL